MKKSFILTLFTVVVASVSAQRITLEDVLGYKYAPETVVGLRPLADGETYAQMTAARNAVVRCSFKDGSVIDTLFSLSSVRGAKLSAFSDYIVSPDEATMLIKTNATPIYRRSSTADYYIYNIKNKKMEPLSKGGPQECPKFSPDGTMVAFVRDNNIHLVKLLFNNAESQVTKDGEFNKVLNGKPDWVYEEEFEFNCAYDFSSDSQMLAWVRFDESSVPTFSFPWYAGSEPVKSEYKLYPGAYVYKYPKAGEKNSSVSVHSFDIKSRVVRDVKVPVDADGYIPRIQFTGQKDKLMVLTLNRHQNQLDFYLADARTTNSQLILREKADKYIEVATYSNLDFSSDRFVLASERDGYRNLYLYSLNGTLLSQLTSGNAVVTDYYGTDGRSYYFASTEGNPTEKYVCKVDAQGKKQCLTSGRGCNSAIFSKGCRYFLNNYSDLNTPNVYAIYSAAGKKLKTLQDNAALKAVIASADLGSQELFSFTTSEGVSLNGWMVKPRNFSASRRYPVLMYQYSGPGSQQVLNAYSNGFFGALAWEQYLASKGYIVVCVDGRGTGGRGAEFQQCTYMRLGDLESKDQVETALYLSTLPYVDKSRIAIWGWSFGGFNTLMSLSEGRKVFNCGVAVAPVTDWRYYDSVYTERYMRTPQENPTGYDCSPLHRCQKLSGDLLLIHGLADDNVHFQNTAELSEALVQQDYQFDMQTYTNRNHSIYGGNTRRHLFKRIENYLDSHLRP